MPPTSADAPVPDSILEVIAQAESEEFETREALAAYRLDAAATRYRRKDAIRYGVLARRARRLAHLFEREGVARGGRVAVLLDNGIDLVASEWACLLSGRLWVALNARSAAAENAAILADAQPGLILVDETRREALDGCALPAGARVLDTGRELDDLLFDCDAQFATAPPAAGDPVRIRYTSGTSGSPKGAVLTLANYDASLRNVGHCLEPLGPRDVLVHAAPMTHASGAMFAPHAAVGARAIALDRFDVAAFLTLVETEQVTAVFLVPTMLLRVLDALGGPGELPSLRSIVYGGAAMPADRLQRGLELLGQVFVGIYGLTESTWPVAALLRAEHPVEAGEQSLARLASCGKPPPGNALRIVAKGGEELGCGEVGEIQVRGANTMAGYWDPRSGAVATQTSGPRDLKGLDEQGWMHTGDLGRRDEEGFVTIVDRLHDMIVSGGFNVYPREVEDALSSHPAVLEAAVVGRPDAQWGEVIVACVVLREAAEATAAELAAHVAQRTADYKKPRIVEFRSELPRNAAGKILRRALREVGA